REFHAAIGLRVWHCPRAWGRAAHRARRRGLRPDRPGLPLSHPDAPGAVEPLGRACGALPLCAPGSAESLDVAAPDRRDIRDPRDLARHGSRYVGSIPAAASVDEANAVLASGPGVFDRPR